MSNSGNDAWSLYWQSANMHSCLAADAGDDQKLIEAQWFEFARELADGDHVLDLATGNGAVAYALLSANPALHISAVDAADIYPQQSGAVADLLQKVNFFANTDVLRLDSKTFKNHSYAAITSQFGVEYAGINEVLRCCADLVKSGGKLKWIVHHQHSELVKSSANTLEELAHLLANGSLVDALIHWVSGKVDFNALEAKGRENIDQCPNRSKRISGQVFDAVVALTELVQQDRALAIESAQNMKSRMLAEQERLRQLLNAAQSEKQISAFNRLLSDLGFDKITSNEVVLEPQGYLLAWNIEAEKK